MNKNASSSAKEIARQLCPPVLWNGLRSIKGALSKDDEQAAGSSPTAVAGQDIDIYWDPHMGEILETWGVGNVWHEIQMLLASSNGKVLDIACGTGGAMVSLAAQRQFDLYGCDISDLLIDKAIAKNIVPPDHLMVTDATKLSYADKSFDYSYSIGSLEHFTEEGILQFLRECDRVTKNTSFHQIPVSRSNENEGWLKLQQSFYNNNVEWWMEKYSAVFKKVYVHDSLWNSPISLGKWFVCSNED